MRSQPFSASVLPLRRDVGTVQAAGPRPRRVLRLHLLPAHFRLQVEVLDGLARRVQLVALALLVVGILLRGGGDRADLVLHSVQ